MEILNYFRVRKGVHYVVSSNYFEMTVMLVICLSSIALASEDPVDPDHPRNKILNKIDYAFTGVFTVEMTLKVCRQFDQSNLQLSSANADSRHGPIPAPGFLSA